MICGLEGRFRSKLRHIEEIIGLSEGVSSLAAMSLMITTRGPVFLADTHVQVNPDADAIASIAIACASHVQRFGIAPKIAMISHSDFGEHDTPSSLKMRAGHGACPQALPPTRNRWRNAGRYRPHSVHP